MKFTLYYRGPLPSSGRPPQKHKIRRAFHSQLSELWGHPPLSTIRDKVLRSGPGSGEISILRQVETFTFAPLICTTFDALAHLKITLLRPEPPGKLITQAGDIDNRLKTLLDALKMPRDAQELPPDSRPAESETPFFCLLEDDNLIASLSVDTHRLLEPESESSDVVLLIGVTTSRTASTMINFDF